MMKIKTVLLFVVGVIAIVGIWGFLVEPYNIKVRDITINSSSGLGDVLEGLSVLHLSDLHIDKIGRREEDVLGILERTNPDVIFLTGDYVKWRGDNGASLEFLSQLKARIGIWGVMGDYDYSFSRKSCLFCHLENSGAKTNRHSVAFLRNSCEKIALPKGEVLIMGLDKEADKPFGSIVEYSELGRPPAILLSHSPLSFDTLDPDMDVLMLAGDTHGGQIPLPSWVWDMMGYEKTAKYAQGFFQEGKKKMYVTSGVGTSKIPFRLFRRPEAVIFRFE